MLRVAEQESQIVLNFDCPQSSYKRAEQLGYQRLRLETVTATLARTSVGVMDIPAGMSVFAVNFAGTFIGRTGSSSKLVLVPPRSMTYARGPLRIVLLAARGEHNVQMLSWPSMITPVLDNWVSARPGNRNPNAKVVACKPIDPHFQGALERFQSAADPKHEYGEPLMLSVVYEVVTQLIVGGDQVQLAPLPLDLPDTILGLTKLVRQNPAGSWSLREAAEAAGYSPFHFSRVFKQMVSYGFHEYVDRCRTECAVEMLCTSDQAVDVVASTCGFGTTQGLRESVKEYLGLVPSEFRIVPEAVDSLGD